MEMGNKDLLEKLKAIKEDRGNVKNLTDDELNYIYEQVNSSKVNGNKKGKVFTKIKSKNERVDGYAGPVILAAITLFFGIIFMLIIFR